MKLMATFEALAQAIPVKQQRNVSFSHYFRRECVLNIGISLIRTGKMTKITVEKKDVY